MRLDLWLSGFQAEGGLHLASPEHGLAVPVLLAVCLHQPKGFTPQENIYFTSSSGSDCIFQIYMETKKEGSHTSDKGSRAGCTWN